MAKQKPQYPQSELKKIGQPYDYNAIGFKNSQIDMLKSKMNNFAESYQKESADIIPAREAGFPMPQKSNRMASRYVGQGLDRIPDVSKRNYIIDKVYNAQGKLTGKKGVSKSALREHLPDLNRYRLNERADELKSSGDYIDSVNDAKRWAEIQKQNAINTKKWDAKQDSLAATRGYKRYFDPNTGTSILNYVGKPSAKKPVTKAKKK